MALRWGQAEDVDAILAALDGTPPDLCNGSDICYFEDDFELRFDSLRRLNAKSNVLAIQRRDGCDISYTEVYAGRAAWQIDPNKEMHQSPDFGNGHLCSGAPRPRRPGRVHLRLAHRR